MRYFEYRRSKQICRDSFARNVYNFVITKISQAYYHSDPIILLLRRRHTEHYNVKSHRCPSLPGQISFFVCGLHSAEHQKIRAPAYRCLQTEIVYCQTECTHVRGPFPVCHSQGNRRKAARQTWSQGWDTHWARRDHIQPGLLAGDRRRKRSSELVCGHHIRACHFSALVGRHFSSRGTLLCNACIQRSTLRGPLQTVLAPGSVRATGISGRRAGRHSAEYIPSFSKTGSRKSESSGILKIPELFCPSASLDLSHLPTERLAARQRRTLAKHLVCDSLACVTPQARQPAYFYVEYQPLAAIGPAQARAGAPAASTRPIVRPAISYS